MAKLLRVNQNGKSIISVVLLMTTEREKHIYKSFMQTETALMKCPNCGARVEVDKVKDYFLIIHNPLANSALGFPTGEPVVRCTACKKPIKMSLMDITPFTAVTEWLRTQKAKAQKVKGK